MKPEDYDLLARMLDFETSCNPERYPLGWEWHDVGAVPITLMRLVTQGFLSIEYKSNNHTYYKLTPKGRTIAHEALSAPEPETMTELPAITGDIFGDIEGYDDAKELITCSLMLDRPIHVLLYGPPALAKTMFLRSLEQFGGSNAMWVSGSAASQAGIWDELAARRPRWLLIDELEKMPLVETASLLNLMENGRIVRVKSKRNLDIELTCWVIATANTIHRLPPELLSRFARVEVKEYNTVDYEQVIINVLTRREEVDEKTAREIAKALMGKTRDVRDAVRVARMSKKTDVETAVRLLFQR